MQRYTNTSLNVMAAQKLTILLYFMILYVYVHVSYFACSSINTLVNSHVFTIKMSFWMAWGSNIWNFKTRIKWRWRCSMGKKILEVHAYSYLMHDQNTELHKLQQETRIILLLPGVNKNSKIFMICTYNLNQRLSIKTSIGAAANRNTNSPHILL